MSAVKESSTDNSAQDAPAIAVRGMAQAARAASRVLSTLTEEKRNAVLEAFAVALEEARGDTFEDNADDLQRAEQRTGAAALPAATLSRLRLTDAKFIEMVEGIRSVAKLPDPLARTLDAIELDNQGSSFAGTTADDAGLHLTKISVPLGVLAVIFEARPDAVTQIASLAIKSGNAVLLKAGSEVAHTAEGLTDLLRDTLVAQGLPKAAVCSVYGRDSVDELLKAHDLIDMVIPRGSKQLVEYVQAHTRIPVLGHAEGVCHIYVDQSADAELALRVIADAKTDYPAACNSVETVLVHRAIAAEFVPRLAAQLQQRGVRLHGDDAVHALSPNVERVTDWHTEYGELALSFGVVDSVDAAIAHIHEHGSLHTESILAEDVATAERFLREVDSAGVFHNCSTRFADGFRYGFGAEVGVSTSKFHARGPVGLEGLTTYKYLLRGHGHVAGDYRGPNAPRAFTHRRESDKDAAR